MLMESEEEFFNAMMKREMLFLAAEKTTFDLPVGTFSYVENPEMIDYVKAHNAVASAVKKGKLVAAKELRCSVCKQPAYDYHHYLGYEEKNWLKVKPLCKPCHQKASHDFDAIILKRCLQSVSFLST